MRVVACGEAHLCLLFELFQQSHAASRSASQTLAEYRAPNPARRFSARP
jgi:hypothetical protein